MNNLVYLHFMLFFYIMDTVIFPNISIVDENGIEYNG